MIDSGGGTTRQRHRARDFAPTPICALSWENEDSSVAITHDPGAAEYTITLG